MLDDGTGIILGIPAWIALILAVLALIAGGYAVAFLLDCVFRD